MNTKRILPKEIQKILDSFYIVNESNLEEIKIEIEAILKELPQKVVFHPRLINIEYEDYSKIGNSRFGGVPDLPKNIEYPILDGKYYEFICQINFSELKFENYSSPISEGMLYVFKSGNFHLNDFKVFYHKETKNLERKYPPIDMRPIGQKPSFGFKPIFKLDYRIDELFLEKLNELDEDLYDDLISLNYENRDFKTQIFSTSMDSQRSIYLMINGFDKLAHEYPFYDKNINENFDEKFQKALNDCAIHEIDPPFRKEYKK